MISETVYGILSVAAGITTITTNIFPVVIPQKANPPAITYQRSMAMSNWSRHLFKLTAGHPAWQLPNRWPLPSNPC